MLEQVLKVLLLLLSVMFIVYSVVSLFNRRRRCQEVLGGISNKQCLLRPGHSGPHITEWQGQTYWFETGTRIELLDKRRRLKAMGDKMKSIWRFGWMPSPAEKTTYVNAKGLWRKVAGSLFVLVSKGKEQSRGR